MLEMLDIKIVPSARGWSADGLLLEGDGIDKRTMTELINANGPWLDIGPISDPTRAVKWIAVIAPDQRHAFLWAEYFEDRRLCAIDHNPERPACVEFDLETPVAEERRKKTSLHWRVVNAAIRFARRAAPILTCDMRDELHRCS